MTKTDPTRPFGSEALNVRNRIGKQTHRVMPHNLRL
jgi:hypothetical protein